MPVLAYGPFPGVVAVLSTGAHRLAGIGAALLLPSDGLIALRAPTPGFDLPHDGFWMMLTHTLA